MTMLGLLNAWLAAAVCAAGGPAAAGAVDGELFRMENKVFVGDQQEPAVQSTTLFLADRVYDFLDSPAEVTVFDKARGRFILLDLVRRVKTELTTDRVASLTERLQQWARNQSDPFLKFLADPTFEEQFDEAAGQLAFASPWMTYQIKTMPAGSEVVSRQYRDFSDWYCRLNTTINPGSRPPFARLKVNAVLATRHRLPREVVLTMRPKTGLLAKRITIRSEHKLVRGLAKADRDRVAQTDQFMAIFKPVSFAQYQGKIAE